MINKNFLRVQGLNRAANVLKTLEATGKAYRGAAYKGTRREDGKITNAQLLTYLEEGGRDFRTPTAETGRKMAEIFAQELDKRISRVPELRSDKGKINKAKAKKVARKVTGLAYRAAMKRWIRDNGKMLDNSETADGPADAVGKAYASQRAKRYDMPDDQNIVGKASGELLADMQPSLTAGLIELLE